jgi:NhaP-type Na+/H+ or K+/H+ antiporter
MWIKHPRTKQPDTMLTMAVAGFVFSGVVAAASMTYLFVKGLPLDTFSDVAILVGAILTPTVAAYTARKYSDFKLNGNGQKKGSRK